MDSRAETKTDAQYSNVAESNKEVVKNDEPRLEGTQHIQEKKKSALTSSLLMSFISLFVSVYNPYFFSNLDNYGSKRKR